MKTLLTLGHGYCAQELAQLLLAQGWDVIGTARNDQRAGEMAASGVTPLIYPCDLAPALARATHILISAAPTAQGDVFLHEAGDALRSARPDWVGYLSTTAVYGDHQGAWVDEQTPPRPQSNRAIARVLAENQWLATGLPVHIFRLAGIYGPGRGPFEKIRDGSARQIIKKNQVFSRTHVTDIAQVLAASIARPDAGQVYNVCDDNPAPPEEVLCYAADLLGMPHPARIDYETAVLPEMVRSFYAESKRVSNEKIKSALGVTLRYPTYQAGLQALLKSSQAGQ
jgi:nucleoside-diphosphate-sugar epimerase